MNAQLTRLHIDQLLSYLTPSLSFVNCHMVEFITGNLWEKFVPQDIQKEIKTEQEIHAACKYFLANDEDKQSLDTGFRAINDDGELKIFTKLKDFIAKAETHRLDNFDGVFMTESELFDAMGIHRKSTAEPLNIKEFMNEKKNHEVNIFSKLIADITSYQKDLKNLDMYVLDAGDGKGYLSSRLALQYNFKVLGIDASEVNTKGSQKRMQKLERAWAGLKERTEIINQGLTPARRSRKIRKQPPVETFKNISSTNYKSVNNYIIKDTDLNLLLKEHFDVGTDFYMCLTGLHTCGNLASICLESFAKNPKIKLLCNVGCCYHLLNEMYCSDNFTNTDLVTKANIIGFPMSNYLKGKRIQLGRNARMLASQSAHRTQIKNELNTQSLFYRAVLEVILKERYPHLKERPRVGKIKKFSTFREYLERCDQKCNLGLDLESDFMEEILDKYAKMEPLLTLFYLLRMSYAPIIESLILLDRLLFLQEYGIEQSYLIRLFDPVTSPRCYGIVAIR